MNIEILPGFSLKNRDWAENVQQYLNSTTPAIVNYWPHWHNEHLKNNWKQIEAKKLSEKYKNANVNILAKSIGTLILMTAIQDFGLKPNKIILCGIPLNDLDEVDKKYYQIIKSISPENVLVMQNESDNHGSFNEVKDFIGLIHPEIKLVSKPRNDHEYPYSADFLEFLK